MFSPELIPVHLETLSRDGYVVLENGIDGPTLDRIGKLIERPLSEFTINGNRGYVEQDNMRYLFQTFTWGKVIVDVYTNTNVIELAAAYSGEDVHLSNHRIYRSFPSRVKMKWHVDNKIDEYDYEQKKFVTHQAPSDKGLIMIAYLGDVQEGGFQIVKGSHRWGIYDKEEWTEADIKAKKGEIITFNNKKRGLVVIYDYRCVHRAQPYQAGPHRTSLFAQYSPASMPIGEPIFLNTRDIPELTEHQKQVLNFGKSPSTENWPIGSKRTNIKQFGNYLLKE
jgi:ectoine hydroxylase-related dioxygenase (phytanoyl-CoA dioxygenase family)